jgi:hypothetical protein
VYVITCPISSLLSQGIRSYKTLEQTFVRLDVPSFQCQDRVKTPAQLVRMGILISSCLGASISQKNPSEVFYYRTSLYVYAVGGWREFVRSELAARGSTSESKLALNNLHTKYKRAEERRKVTSRKSKLSHDISDRRSHWAVI